MKIVVTGGRDYNDREFVFAVLDSLHIKDEITLLAHGACHLGGADILAEDWAKSREVPYFGMPAKFKSGTGKIEGPLRNARMLDTIKPEMVVAFPGGVGTTSCINEARKRDITVLEYSRE